MKCAVIGSEGYIGRHLVYFLKEMGADVFCYDLNISSSHQQYKRLDVTDPISLRDLNLDVDYLFVFSGITGTSVGYLSK
ncbi:NAD-dependent epimerase/dehydratase family protein [Parabacteroides goldsteinii]|uniref:NAD-dependent epimerase/dehydratase family protein n=1 Tax=Parabacteroides goldsteinii TaxID=328812 RepID=UPI002AB9C00B|nr:NAD-dependent epimerase/dehydratase family protein [Parabacteroides goldsteinii]MDZ3925355.1 NAD-dependent epimerase/dehydratase family protein [Parabacteroides goldsteinii]